MLADMPRSASQLLWGEQLTPEASWSHGDFSAFSTGIPVPSRAAKSAQMAVKISDVLGRLTKILGTFLFGPA